jgi:type IV secretory pathway VirB4 component
LVLDEAWVMLGHPAFRTKLREWLKVLRKSNVAVIFATQSLSDLSHSGIDDVIFESCPSKILLPSPQAQTEALSGLYQAIGLNRRQIRIVSNAVPKRQYYHLHPDGSRVFELGLTPPEMAFVGASGREDLARIRHLQKLDARGWPSAWLRERGQFDAARLWESY